MPSVTSEGMRGNIAIRPLADHEEAPMDLLLLADPSEEIVSTYLRRGRCFVAVEAVKNEADENTVTGHTDTTDKLTPVEEMVGVYVLIETRPETVELVNVAVAESLHGRGIGKGLVQHSVETAREMGYKSIELGTGNSGVVQLALYQKCGFRIVGVDLDFFVRHFPEPIYENGIQCRDMIRLVQHLAD